MAVANAQPAPDENLPATEVNSGVPVDLNEGQEATSDANQQGVDLLKTRYKRLTRGRQIQLLIALAATITTIVVIALWSMKPSYKMLYGNLDEKSSGEIIEVLKQQGISYEVDEKTGQIAVPPDKIHDIRIMLAAKGLPKEGNAGFELLDEKQSFGTSQFMEKARYFRALEGELARSITGIDSVESARVHLAIPKQSVFIRDRREPSASVLVKLENGKSLGESQIAAIVHLVASSIPDMKSENVTVVDQKGNMLTKNEMSGAMAQSSAQFDYRKKLENYYIERIERILTPIVGFDGVRAQVDAEVDFTSSESTQESFNPDLPAVRSEQTMEEESRGGDIGGVPGALTNQPPGVATVPEKAPKGNASKPESPSRKTKRSTYNYELDKTVSHTKKSPGSLKRLSVAVVLDDKVSYDDAGNMVRTPMTPEEVERITGLVKEAVGFNVQRGDSVNVVNTSFHTAEPPPEPAGPIWEQPWFIEIAKQAAGVLFVLILIMLLLRPVLRDLTYKAPEPEEMEGELEGEGAMLDAQGIARAKRDATGLSAEDWAKLGLSAEEYQEMLNTLRKLVTEDPRLVAQVVKTWVAADDTAEYERKKNNKKSKGNA